MDERFLGWGQEDEALSLALERIVGRPLVLTARCLHLCHERIGISGNDRWPGQTIEQRDANRRLGHRYRAARTSEQMRRLLEEGRAVAV